MELARHRSMWAGRCSGRPMGWDGWARRRAGGGQRRRKSRSCSWSHAAQTEEVTAHLPNSPAKVQSSPADQSTALCQSTLMLQGPGGGYGNGSNRADPARQGKVIASAPRAQPHQEVVGLPPVAAAAPLTWPAVLRSSCEASAPLRNFRPSRREEETVCRAETT